MIKAIFFDWFNTLAHFEPARHRLYSEAFQKLGIEIPTLKIIRGILTGDQYFFEENAKSPVNKRSPEEQVAIYLHYPRAVLAEAGVDAPKELPLKILDTVKHQFEGAKFALFDDVLPVLKTLKQRKVISGLITNLAKDVNPMCRELGLEPYLDFTVTSEEAGADKPNPPIFLAALDKAKIEPSEAVHVGDQYKLDVVGARSVGISPILIDRYDLYPEINDCPRIHSLTELAQYL